MKWLKLAVLIGFLGLIGCSSNPFVPPVDGGSIQYKVETTTTTTTQEKPVSATQPAQITVVTEKKTVETSLKQPDNPTTPTKIDINPETGEATISLPGATIPSMPSAPTPSQESLGKVIWMGGGVIILGAIVAIWYMKPGIGVVIAGTIMMTLAAVLDKAAGPIGTVITIGLGTTLLAALIIGGVTYYRWGKDKKALVQTKKGLDRTKVKKPQVWAEVETDLKESQDESIKNYIKNLQ